MRDKSGLKKAPQAQQDIDMLKNMPSRIKALKFQKPQ